MLELVPVSLKEANAFVEQHHRHHKPVVGHKFSVAAAVAGEIVGAFTVHVKDNPRDWIDDPDNVQESIRKAEKLLRQI